MPCPLLPRSPFIQLFLVTVCVLSTQVDLAEARVAKKTIDQRDRESGLIAGEPAEAPTRPRVTLFSIHTREARAIFSQAPASGLISSLMACRLTGEVIDFPERLVSLLLEAALHFGADRAEIISGFRSIKLNELLRKKGRGVAQNSRHTLGQALDFRLRRVGSGRLGRWLRRRHDGGVGIYRRSGFVHIDVGPRRSWRGR